LAFLISPHQAQDISFANRLWTEIMNAYNDDDRKSIVVGTAGIGKSLFRFYLAWRS
jgi:hypothetical protein